jgi:hypothetical protein
MKHREFVEMEQWGERDACAQHTGYTPSGRKRQRTGKIVYMWERERERERKCARGMYREEEVRSVSKIETCNI